MSTLDQNSLARTSFRALSRIVSSGANSVASAIVERDNDGNSDDQVSWAGFDTIECEGDVTRKILLLGYRFGFQVWDVEEADNLHEIISKNDGHVSFMQMIPKPISSRRSGDKFASSHPLLAICTDGSFSAGYPQDVINGNIQNSSDHSIGESSGIVPCVVWIYSLKSQSYVHLLKFRSVVYSVRCSRRIVAVLQAAQIQCFDAASLERDYTILMNPVVMGYSGSGIIGVGPLALGPRWIAYSGTVAADSNSGRVSPQHLTPSESLPILASSGSLVAHYAKKSSKQIAAGIVGIREMGYKKISRYYSELVPDGNYSLQFASPGWKGRESTNDHLSDADDVGMVIVRDVINRSVIAQFRAHKSPISSLCFDPSGTLLVTASVQGHNINVFRIMPQLSGSSSGSDSGASHVQLYRLQRGLTNAVIQDISFSDDSHWIMISSSRGTSHLFDISPSRGQIKFQFPDASSTCNNSGSDLQTCSQHTLFSSSPITVSAVSRIRSGNNGWRSTITGAAAAASGRTRIPSGSIASAFHHCKGNYLYTDSSSFKEYCQILVFSPGCMIQYALRISSGLDSVVSGLNTAYELNRVCDARLVVEAIKKWNICQKHNRRERDDRVDLYSENKNPDSSKIFAEGVKKENSLYNPEVRGSAITKVNISPKENHHIYISGAELKIHQPQIPLWAKPEIYFQCMTKDDIEVDGLEGEIEIERVRTRLMEPRSRDLVPLLGCLQTTKFQQARVPALKSNNNNNHQKSSVSSSGLHNRQWCCRRWH